MFGRELRSRLDLISKKVESPSLSSELPALISHKQCLQVKNYGGKNQKDFEIGDTVWFKQFVSKNKFSWSKGTIIRKFGKVMYKIKLDESNKNIVRHKNQLHSYKGSNDIASNGMADVWDVTLPQEEVQSEICSNEMSELPPSPSSAATTEQSSPSPTDSPVSIASDNESGSDTTVTEQTNSESPHHQSELATSEPGTPWTSPNSSLVSGSPEFSKPRPATHDDYDDPHTPMPARGRRNRPIVDYKKFF